ncbi:MAG: hypothetical protein ACTTKD_07680 [Peptoanaerobacter stomatis]|uniref:hypothetical protein n=1 Tax=Peptoanaerobacter stomatis TaxID=796937 RepID=UPI003F9FA7D5
MAKGYSETCTIMLNGVLNIIDDGNIIVEVEDIGDKNLKDALAKLNGELVSITAKLKTEIE